MGTKKNRKIRQEQNRTRTNQVKYRLSDAEYKMYLKKVESSGMTQQEFFLHLLSDSNIVVDSHIKQLTEVLQAIYDLLRQVKGIANNCNQIARICNIDKKAPSVKKYQELSKNCNEFVQEGNIIWALLKR